MDSNAYTMHKCTCGETFDNAADLGSHQLECDGKPVEQPAEQPEPNEPDTMSETQDAATTDAETEEQPETTETEAEAEAGISRFHACRIGPATYSVTIDGEISELVETGIYKANLETGEVTTLESTAESGALAANQRIYILDRLVRQHQPSVNELAYQQAFKLVRGQNGSSPMYAHEAMGETADNSGDDSAAAQDDSRDSPAEDIAIVSDAPADHDYDAEQLVANVERWLSNYASVKGDMIEGAYDVSFVEMTDPETGGSELGVYIDDAPWHGPHWDHDAGHFEGGSQPDEWADHNDAMRSIYNADDSPVEAIVEENEGGYDDWHNYVPADEAEDLL